MESVKSCELHAHLYGCLDADDLSYLAARKPARWDIFRNSYQRVYGCQPDLKELFTDAKEAKARLREYSIFASRSNFSEFQVRFDFVIALSHTDPEELYEIARRVTAARTEAYCEYRMMFAPNLEGSQFREKVQAFIEGLARATRENKGKESRAVLSLDRQNEKTWMQYEILREIMASSAECAENIVAIDFCHVEEGHPPRDKARFMKKLLEDNRRDPTRALAILYHVAESFRDKSVESAVRWTVQAAELGAHRLGHALALGIEPKIFQDSLRRESVLERKEQIYFELEHASSLLHFDHHVDSEELHKELDDLKDRAHEDEIKIHYDEVRIRKLRALQNWAMDRIRSLETVIESCPTSNLRIGGIESAQHHPLARFLKNGLVTVVGSDDPGIFAISLESEFELISGWSGVGPEMLPILRRNALASVSEKMSGRIRANADPEIGI